MHVKKGKIVLAVVLSFVIIFTLFLSPSFAINGNKPPHVDFHRNPSGDVHVNELIHFYDDSTDEDGEIIAWQWDFGDGTYAIIPDPTHAYSNDGTYDVTLTVIDNNGSKNSTTKQVNVVNLPPVADAGPDQIVNETSVTFDGSESYDPDGTIISYIWYFGDGKSKAGVTVTHNYSEDGIYTAKLNVTDDDGAYDEDTCQVTVDTTDPKTNISVDGTKGDNDWYVTNVSIMLFPTDATSGIDKTYYMINEGAWKIYSTTFVISDEGENILKYYSVDNAGNVEKVNTKIIKIDKTAPTIVIKKPEKGYLYFFGRDIFPTLREKTIIIGRITVEVNITSTPSGIKDVKFYVDGYMKYNTSESPYTWNWGMAFGKHTLKVKAIDKAGHNASKEIEVTIFSILPGKNTSEIEYAYKEE